MKYNYKIYNKVNNEVLRSGITSGRGNRSEQTTEVQSIRSEVYRDLGIKFDSIEANNVKISMKATTLY